MLVANQFPATFAQIVLAIDAVIISAIVAAYSGRIANACAVGLHHLSEMLASLVAHLGSRHK